MKNILSFLTLFLSLAAFSAASLPVHAEEGKGDKKEAKSEGEGKSDKGKGGGTEGVSGGKFAGDPVYVHLSPMVLPVISESGVEQLVTIQIDVEVKDFDAADKMHTNMPRVMDALMSGLYGGLGQGSLRKGKLVDVSKVKAKATAALDHVMGDGDIKNVLVQGVSQRML